MNLPTGTAVFPLTAEYISSELLSYIDNCAYIIVQKYTLIINMDPALNKEKRMLTGKTNLLL